MRRVIGGVLLTIAGAILVHEIISAWPYIITYVPGDYAYFLGCGHALQERIYHCFYPLPAVLLIFLPLSFLPTWFALVWILLPFIFVLCIFGKKGIAVWLSYPFLVQAAFGELEGLLLLPIYWLIQDHTILAGISAAFLTLKPQLAVFLVPFMVYRWFSKRNWRSLVLFLGALLVLYLPAFLIDPFWPSKMIVADQVRVNESIQLTRGATLWGWWWHGGWTIWVLPLLVAVTAALSLRAFGKEEKQTRAMYLLDLILVPILYAVSFVTAIPTLKKSTLHLLVYTIVSWIAVGFDILTHGWGGVYVLIPLVALLLLAMDPNPIILSIPTGRTARWRKA